MVLPYNYDDEKVIKAFHTLVCTHMNYVYTHTYIQQVNWRLSAQWLLIST